MGLSAREHLLLGVFEMWICCSLPVSFLPVQVKKKKNPDGAGGLYYFKD